MEKPFRLSDPVRRVLDSYQAALYVLPEKGVEVGADVLLHAEATAAGLAWETFRERGGRSRPIENGLLTWAEVAEEWGAQHAAPLDADTVAVWDSIDEKGRIRPQDAQEGPSRPRGHGCRA